MLNESRKVENDVYAAGGVGYDDDSSVYDEDEWCLHVVRRSYTADFETTVDESDCRVWAAGVCEIGGRGVFEYGNSIEWFMRWCREHAQCNVYFHNLAFDGAFIMDHLERNGWRWVPERRQATDMTYTTVINDANQVYCIELFFTPFSNVRIMDSLKIIPLPIAKIAKAFDLPIRKGEIDYSAPRPVGHVITDEERAYLENDVRIAAEALDHFLSQGMNRMTAGSNALSDYRDMSGGKKGFRKWFPVLDDDCDEFIRRAYRGGFTYADPRFSGRELGSGIVYDVNSLYPSVMYGSHGESMPYGHPVWFDGAPEPKEPFNLWVASITCSFRLRDDHIPCIQLKGNFRFSQTEYLSSSNGRVTFNVCNVDWDLINRQYIVYDVEWHGGFYFRSSRYLFRPYIDKWTKVKVESAESGNMGMRQLAKLMLNSLYGKFATRKTVYSRRPLLDDRGVLRYVDLDPEQREGVYIPVGVFTTAYARSVTIGAAQALYGRFAYADTDSVHILGDDEPDCIAVDDFELGKWKLESRFTRAKFLRAKCYIEYGEGDAEPTVHVSGMPAACHSQVNMDNFDFGAEYFGKLYTHRVAGGIVLVPDKMVLRE